MQKVDRHFIKQEDIQHHLEARLKLVLLDLETARERPEFFNFNQYLTNVQYYLGYLAVSYPLSARICWALQLLSNGVRALFSAAAAHEATISTVLDEEEDVPVVLPTRDASLDAGAHYWQAGFYAAILLRRRPVLDDLCDVPIDLFRRSEIRVDECRYLFIAALQSFWKREKDVSSRLLAAIKAADPSLVHLAPDYIFAITEPEMQLLFRLLTLDAAAFNATLVDALTSFKSYWDSDERRLHPAGYLASGALAFAALAYDLEMPVEVESEYLPADLYQGACS